MAARHEALRLVKKLLLAHMPSFSRSTPRVICSCGDEFLNEEKWAEHVVEEARRPMYALEAMSR